MHRIHFSTFVIFSSISIQLHFIAFSTGISWNVSYTPSVFLLYSYYFLVAKYSWGKSEVFFFNDQLSPAGPLWSVLLMLIGSPPVSYICSHFAFAITLEDNGRPLEQFLLNILSSPGELLRTICWLYFLDFVMFPIHFSPLMISLLQQSLRGRVERGWGWTGCVGSVLGVDHFSVYFTSS